MIVILVSLLVHEYGHALSAKSFGQEAQISLVAMGGLTYHDGKKLKGWQDFVVVLMGPVAGISLFALAFVLRSLLGPNAPTYLWYLLSIFIFVNLFWTAVNLLPIVPLDGGQMLRIVLEGFFGHRGLKITLFIGVIVAVGLGILFFVLGMWLIGAILFLLAFQSFASFKQIQTMTVQDRSDDLQKELKDAQEAFHLGHLDQAKEMLEAICRKAHQGLIFEAASENLAYIYEKSGDLKKVYEVLKPIEKKLSQNARRVFHRAAYSVADYELTLTVGNKVFREAQSHDVAFLNALAAAQLKDIKMTVGWLECAVNHGMPNLKESLNRAEFNEIKKEATFQSFLERHGLE